VSKFVTSRPGPILAGSGLLVAALVALVPTLDVNDQYFEYFDHSLPVRTGSEFAIEHLSSPYVTSFSLESGESQGVADPEVLSTVEAFTDFLEARPAVAHVASFSPRAASWAPSTCSSTRCPSRTAWTSTTRSTWTRAPCGWT
jgi:predicted RND superfamily exporter protein